MVRSFALRVARTASFCFRTLVIGLVTAVAVLVVGGPDWGNWLGVGRSSAVMAQEQSEASAATLRRVADKNQVLDRLLAEDLSLVEAAAWFRHLNANPSHHAVDYSSHWTGDSEGEKLCRQVIAWVRNRLGVTAESESQADALVLRLERELDDLLSRDGRVELPW